MLPAPPEGVFAPHDPKASECPASGQCPPLAGAHTGDIRTLRGWLQGYQQASERTPLMQGLATTLPKASKAPRPTPSSQRKPRMPSPTLPGLGICPDNGRTAAPTQGQADERARGSLFNTHKEAPRLPACGFARHLFTFPASWILSWSLSQLGGNNLPSYLTQKDSQLSAHKHGLCLSLNESSVN